MDQTKEHSNPQQDGQLADFADQALKGKLKSSASPSTDDLFGLEETILRLNSSFPQDTLNEASVKQMHVRLKSRIRREEQNAKPSFWKKWFGRELSPQLGLAFAVLAILVVALVSAPFLTPSGSSTTGTAFAPVNFIVVAGLAGVLFVIYWITRRK
jgi:hypothetical protein